MSDSLTVPSHPPSSEPPSFVTVPESQTALPNATVRFRCTFQGTPPFTIKWFKDDTELMTGPNCFTGLDGLSCFLELYSLAVVQSGVYSCQISNEAGSVRCSADLTITGWTSLSSLHIFFAIYARLKNKAASWLFFHFLFQQFLFWVYWPHGVTYVLTYSMWSVCIVLFPCCYCIC